MRTACPLRLIALLALLGSHLEAHAGPPIPPPNDDQTNPIVVTDGDLPYSNLQDTTLATASPDEPAPCFSGAFDKSVWYSFTAASDQVVEIDTFGSTYDTALTVFPADVPPFFWIFASRCSDDASGGVQSKVTLDASAGAIYLVKIDLKEGASCLDSCMLTLNIQAAVTHTVAFVGTTTDDEGCEAFVCLSTNRDFVSDDECSSGSPLALAIVEGVGDDFFVGGSVFGSCDLGSLQGELFIDGEPVGKASTTLGDGGFDINGRVDLAGNYGIFRAAARSPSAAAAVDPDLPDGPFVAALTAKPKPRRCPTHVSINVNRGNRSWSSQRFKNRGRARSAALTDIGDFVSASFSKNGGCRTGARIKGDLNIGGTKLGGGWSTLSFGGINFNGIVPEFPAPTPQPIPQPTPPPFG